MNPADLVSHVRGLGVVLRADGELLRFRPAEKVTPALRAQLLAAKPDVLAYLAAETLPMLPEPPRRGRYVPSRPIPTVCSWCGEPVTTPPGTLPLARRTVCGDLLHAACWAASTRDSGGHQPETPGLDAAIKRADAEKERA